ncbi:unnamed protein product [Closterium sp. NIES-54]
MLRRQADLVKQGESKARRGSRQGEDAQMLKLKERSWWVQVFLKALQRQLLQARKASDGVEHVTMRHDAILLDEQRCDTALSETPPAMADRRDEEVMRSICRGRRGRHGSVLALAPGLFWSSWLTRDAAAHLAIRNHLPLTECAHFGQHRTAQALYDAVVSRYSSPATASLGRILLPYLFPKLSAFPTVEDLVSHLRASDALYRAALPAEFLDKNPPPMYITPNFIVTRLPDSLRSITDHFLSLDPTSLTVDLLEQHLLAAETSAVAASAAAVDVLSTEDVGAASTSAKRCSSKGKGGRGNGGGSESGGGCSSGGSGGGGGGGSGGSGGGSGGAGGDGGGSGGSGGSGNGGSGDGRTGAQRGGSGGDQRQRQQRRSETPSPHAEGDCYRCVPPDPGIDAAALGASESVLLGTAPTEALHTFTLDSSASRCFFRDNTTLTPLPAPVPVRLADSSRGPVIAHSSTVLPCPAVLSGSLSGPVAPPCSCRLVSHQTLLWHHRLGHPSLPRLCSMHSRVLVSGLPRSLPPLPPSPAPPCLLCIEGRQCTAPHSSSFPLTTAPLQTLHMEVWGPARVSGQGRERYFLLVVDDCTRYTTVFPLRSKGEVPDVLIPWIRAFRLQLRERFHTDLPVLRMHSNKGSEFSFDLLRDFCRREGITQSFTLPASPQQNGIAERRIGLVMEVARTSMINVAAPHFPWPFAVRYAAHQLNLWPRVSLPETLSTLRWTGKVGDASVFRVWGFRAFVLDTSADKLSACSIPCDVTFDESVPFYRLFPYRFAPPPTPPLFLAPGPPPVDPLPPQGPAPSGVSQVDPLPGTVPIEVAVGSGAARGAASGGAASGGAELGGAESEGAGLGGAEPGGEERGGEEPWGAESVGVEPGGAEPEEVEPGDAELEGEANGVSEPRGAALSGGLAGALPRLSPQELREWLVQHARLRSGATGAGGAGVTARAGGTGGTGAAGTGGVGGARAGDSTEPGTGGAGAEGAGAGGAGAGGAGSGGGGAGGTGAGGAGAGGVGAIDPRGTVLPQPYFVPLL